MTSRSRLVIRLQAGAILLLSLLATAGVWWQVREHGRGVAATRFDAIANEAITALSKRMEDYEQILLGGVGLFDAVGSVDRHQWRTYVERLRVADNYPGIQGIGFAVRIKRDELPAHVAKVRAEGFPGYDIQPAGDREDYFPIVYLEPFSERNLRAFGFDMFARPTRREAMQRAMDEGSPALSGGVMLVQETDVDVQMGTLLYLPLYAGGGDPGTVEGRRQALLGFVYSPFRMADLIRGVLGAQAEQVDLVIRDGTDLLYGDPRSDQPVAYETHRVIRVYGRPWQVQVRSTPALEAVITVDRSPVVLVAGLLVSVLLTWLTHSMLTERRERIALAAANRALIKARSAAEAANRAKSRFLAAASHDIRQPVQSIMLLTGALARQIEDESARTLLRHLDSATEGLRTLLNSLLDVSRLDAGVIVPEIKTVSTATLLRQLGDEYRLRAEAKGLSFESVVTACAVRTDPALLERILRNLLENALRYTREGRILLRCRARDDSVFIEVEDTGIGIPEDQLQLIFDEFFQAENRDGKVDEDAVHGLGLGLSIVRRLALLLDHRIEARSQPGRGSCFTLTLVRVRAAEDSLVA